MEVEILFVEFESRVQAKQVASQPHTFCLRRDWNSPNLQTVGNKFNNKNELWDENSFTENKFEEINWNSPKFVVICET